MISATEARALQITGISQEEYYKNAYNRCGDAIVDTARKQKGNVTVAVYFLTDDSVEALKKDIIANGYTVEHTERVSEQCHSLNIKWSYNGA